MKQKHIIRVTAKCCDMFDATLNRVIPADSQQDMGETVVGIGYVYNGYVPDWFPNTTVEHYGDYVELDIDVDTGKIVNWKKPTEAQLKATFGGNKKNS